jgi:Flp pilus assembly protein TadG
MARRQTLRPGYLNGQTYAEFMMVVLPTLMFIFGIISFAMTVYTYSFLSNAARDAVRYAVVHGSKSTSPASADDIQTYVRDKAQGINRALSWSRPTGTPTTAPEAQAMCKSATAIIRFILSTT